MGKVSYEVQSKHLPNEIKGPLEAPTRLARSPREFNGWGQWMLQSLLSSTSYRYFSTPQYSWSYQLGRRLNYSPEAILIGAEEGARVDRLWRQADRLIRHQRYLPGEIFILFTGNDLCAPRFELTTRASEFASSLKQGLEYFQRNARPNPKGTRVSVVSFLNLSQLLTKESILNHRVKAHGEMATCRELRQRGFAPRSEQDLSQLPPAGLALSHIFPPNPTRLCPTLFALEAPLASTRRGPGEGQSLRLDERRKKTNEKISTISTRIRSYRDESQQVIKAMQAKTTANSALSWRYLDLSFVDFEGEDMAADCFHLSPAGHSKITAAVLTKH